jgi:hypothetical protein
MDAARGRAAAERRLFAAPQGWAAAAGRAQGRRAPAARPSAALRPAPRAAMCGTSWATLPMSAVRGRPCSCSCSCNCNCSSCWQARARARARPDCATLLGRRRAAAGAHSS